MAMTNFELAKKNYGRTWTDDMLAKLVEKGKLKASEYKEITGSDYTGTTPESGTVDIEKAIEEGVNEV